jgi:hypothetical protein
MSDLRAVVIPRQATVASDRGAFSRSVPPCLGLNLTPLYVLAGVWVVAIVVNFGTSRTYRMELSSFLWILANLLFLGSGKGMYEVFALLVLPSVLIGVTDFFDMGGITMEMTFLVPMVNLIPYCCGGALSRYFPDRSQLSRRYPLTPYVALFSFACILSAFLGHDVKFPSQALRATGVYFMIPFFFYLYSVHAIRRLENVRQIMSVMVLITAFYSSVLGIIQMLWRGRFAMIARNLVVFREDQQEKMWLATHGEGKIMSVWPDSASFGHVLCFTFPLALGLFMTSKTSKQRVLCLAALGLNSVGILITGNRTDILGALVTMVLVVISFAAKSYSLRTTLMKICILGMVLVAFIMVTRESNGLRRLFMPEDWDKKTASSRTILVQEGIRMFKSSPVFGVGLDNFRHNQDYRKDGLYIVANYPHNLFIQILAETGLVGMLSFLALMGAVFRLALVTWRNRTTTELDFFCMLFLIGCTVLIFQGLMENSLFYPQTASLFWTGVGIWRGRAMDLAARPRWT